MINLYCNFLYLRNLITLFELWLLSLVSQKRTKAFLFLPEYTKQQSKNLDRHHHKIVRSLNSYLSVCLVLPLRKTPTQRAMWFVLERSAKQTRKQLKLKWRPIRLPLWNSRNKSRISPISVMEMSVVCIFKFRICRIVLIIHKHASL